LFEALSSHDPKSSGALASSRQHQILTGPVPVGDALESPVTAARDLGVYIDPDVTMTTQVRACFAALRLVARYVAYGSGADP